MLRLTCFVLLLSTGVLFATAEDEDLAGTYTGEWSGASGASGAIHLEFQKSPEGEWKCTASFTMGGEEFKTDVKSTKVEGDKIEVRYQFEMQGTLLESLLTGKRDGATLEGAYKTTTVKEGSPVDEGNWKAVSKKQPNSP